MAGLAVCRLIQRGDGLPLGGSSSVVVEPVGTEVPRLTARVLCGGAEDRALDCDPSVGEIVVPGNEQPLDRHAEEHDAVVRGVDVPPGHAVGVVDARHRCDLDSHITKLRPYRAEEVHRRADRQIERVDSAVEGRKRRAYDRAAPEAAVSAVTGRAPRSGRNRCRASTGHVQKSRRSAARHPVSGIDDV